MIEFSSLLAQGAANAWLFIPSAILLGALHGLEPGHSKTMMAAFIIAVRGSVAQAVMLALAATLSHTAVVWAVALSGMYFGQRWDMAASEPYFQVASGLLIISVAAWMIWRTRQLQPGAAHGHDHHTHGHAHDHHHAHAHCARDAGHDEVKLIDSGHGVLRLEVVEHGQAPRFRLAPAEAGGALWAADQVRVETERPGGERQVFDFRQGERYLESTQDIPEPHEFVARLTLGHGHHQHDFDVEFVEHSRHHHPQHAIAEYAGLDLSAPGYQDPHELAHAHDIRRRFADREVSSGQIVMFGLTGGLIPCPASITVLLLCLQLKKIALGATLVLCFSIGLALTMVASGVLAALSVKHVSRRWSGFGEFARKAPYFSGVLILLVGAYIGWQGLRILL
jgi:nickel/cobalt exporter